MSREVHTVLIPPEKVDQIWLPGSLAFDSDRLRDEVLSWIKENSNDYWNWTADSEGILFRFWNAEDALRFKLTWL